MNVIQKGSLFILSTLLLISFMSCSYQSTTNGSNNKTVEYKATILTDLQKKHMNFITELPLGKGTEYNYSNFKPVETTQELFELEMGDSNTCAFAFDRERYAYIGCNIFPARIVKYDIADMKRISHIDLPSQENRDECRVASMIAISPDTIIHASFSNPCVFTKIDGNTMKITGTLKGEVEGTNDKHIRGMTYDGKYVYAASYSIPGKIVKIDPVTMKKVDDIVFKNEPISDIFAITICGNYLIGVCGRDNPKDATIFRLDLNNLHRKPDVLSIPDYSRYQSICTDNEFIYAATDSNPINVVKVNALSPKLEFVSAFTGEKDKEAGNFSILFNGTDVIVGTWQLESTVKDRLIKLNTEDMTRKDTLILPSKFPADLMYLEPYIYTCSDKPIGVVLRLKY